MDKAPVRLCCGTRHFGVVCPDNTFMCEICFHKTSIDDAVFDGVYRYNICKGQCAIEAGIVEVEFNG